MSIKDGYILKSDCEKIIQENQELKNELKSNYNKNMRIIELQQENQNLIEKIKILKNELSKYKN